MNVKWERRSSWKTENVSGMEFWKLRIPKTNTVSIIDSTPLALEFELGKAIIVIQYSQLSCWDHVRNYTKRKA